MPEDTSAPSDDDLTQDVPDSGADTDESETPVRKRKRWVIAWHGLRFIVLLALAPLVFALIAALTLIDRDISAPSWITSRVAQNASAVMGGGDVTFGEVFINIGRDLHPRVRLRDTVVKDAEGATVARIADIAGLMSPRGLILQGDVLMQDVVLSGAQIDLRRNADGTVALSFAQDSSPADEAGRFTELLDQADQVLEQPAFEALETIRAENLIIAYTDARAGRAWTVDGGRLSLDLRNDQTVLRADLALLAGRANVTAVTATFESPRGSRAATFGVTIDDAIASDIASQSAALSWLSEFEAPLSATLRTTIDAQGDLGPLSAALEMGSGALQPNAATAPIAFESAKAYLTFDPDENRLQFDQIEVAGEMGQMFASGQALLDEDADGLAQSMVAQFRFRDITLSPTDTMPDPLSYQSAQVDMRVGFAPFTVEVGQFAVSGDDLSMWGRGAFLATPEGWQSSFDIEAREINQAAIMSLWPQAPDDWARAWVAENLTFGEITNAQVALRQTPGQPLELAGGFAFADTTMRPLVDTVPMTRAAGVASFAGQRFAMTFDAGRVTPPEGGSLNIAGSTLTILDTLDPRPPMRIDMRFDGSITATMSLMDEPAFLYPSTAGVPVDFAAGRARSHLVVTMPMDSNYAEGELVYALTADLRDFSSDYLVTDRRISARRLVLEANNEVMTVSGPASFDGLPVTGTWTKPFDYSGDSSFSAQLNLSQDFLDAFDIALPRGSVTGAGPARIDVDIPYTGASRFTLTSRLQGVGMAIPAIGWSKPRRTAGNFRVVGTLGDQPTIDRLEIGGGGLSVEGRVILTPDGSLDRAVFSQVRVGNWLNAPITLRGRGGNRPYGVSIRGGQLDLRQARFGAGDGDSGPLSIALDRLQVTEGIALTRFSGEFDGSGGFSGEFDALLNGTAALRGTVAPQNGGSAVRIRSDDAGAMVRAAGLMDNANGGSFDMTLVPTGGEGTFDGTLAIRKIRVRDVPGIAALLDAVSVVGLLQQLDGQGLSFEEVDAKFRLTPAQVILAEASAVGPGLGISLDGIYTLATEQVDFQGVLSPFYLINAIGSVFTRRGEGLIGFNFNILGSSSAPQVSVNPLSAFTPGMFREIFRRPPPVLTE